MMDDTIRLDEFASAHPWEYYDRLRERGDVVWDELSRSWLVSSYELCKEISRHDQDLWRSVNVPGHEAEFGIETDDWIELMGFGSVHGLTVIEGPEHTAQHRWWMRVFSRRRLDAWNQAYFTPIVEREIARWSGSGRAELVHQFADIVPRRMIAAILGLPTDDDELLDRLDALYASRQQVIYAVRTGVAPPAEVVAEASNNAELLHETLAPFVADSAPDSGRAGTPFLRELWDAAPELFGEPFTLQDVTNLASAVWEAGTGTTKNGAANVIYLLATNPELASQVVGEEGLKSRLALVEESLRLFGPVVVNPRTARADTVLGGQQIRAGDRVVMLNNAAGVDEQRFACPFAVDLERSLPRDHFSFGQGPRACPGQHLARAELEAIVEGVAKALPDLALDDGQEAPVLSGALLRRWTPLHVKFSPATS